MVLCDGAGCYCGFVCSVRMGSWRYRLVSLCTVGECVVYYSEVWLGII